MNATVLLPGGTKTPHGLAPISPGSLTGLRLGFDLALMLVSIFSIRVNADHERSGPETSSIPVPVNLSRETINPPLASESRFMLTNRSKFHCVDKSVFSLPMDDLVPGNIDVTAPRMGPWVATQSGAT